MNTLDFFDLDVFMKLLKLFVLLGLLLSSQFAHALTNRFSVIRHHPGMLDSDYTYLMATETLDQYELQFSTFLSYGYRPLELTVAGNRNQGVVDHLVQQQFNVYYGLKDFWQIEASFPVAWLNRFQKPLNPAPGFTNKVGIGDVYLRSRFQLLDRNHNFVGLSLSPYMTIPTGNEHNYISDRKATGGITLAVDKVISSRVNVGINASVKAREDIAFQDYNTETVYGAGFGAQVKVSDHVKLNGDIVTQTTSNRILKDRVTSPTEVTGEVVYSIPQSNFDVMAGGSYAIVKGAGAPRFSTHTGVSYRFKTRDKVKPKRMVFFDHGMSDLDDKAMNTLDRVADDLKDQPNIRLVIATGFTDNTGDKKSNHKLALKRAKVVKTYLVRIHQVAPAKIKIQSVGESAPKASNQTAKGRRLNRRVELELKY